MERRRLDVELVRRKLVTSRAAAQRAIGEGLVEVSGVLEPKTATLVDTTTHVRLTGPAHQFVSRGGDKLDAALKTFAIDASGRRAIDVGASTGGFTDCLLKRGVASVVAVDVGYGQLAWTLRGDPRVTVRERINIRHADPDDLGAPFDLVVVDLSFIGLQLIADQLVALGDIDTDWVLLVKPQFEAGREAVGAGGVVHDSGDRAVAVCAVADAFFHVGLGTSGFVPSPLRGARSGNHEFLLWLRHDAPPPSSADLTRSVVEHG